MRVNTSSRHLAYIQRQAVSSRMLEREPPTIRTQCHSSPPSLRPLDTWEPPGLTRIIRLDVHLEGHVNYIMHTVSDADLPDLSHQFK